MRKRQFFHIGLLTVLLGYGVAMGAASPVEAHTPIVIAAEVPFYPPLARAASQQGVVVLEVVTDGDKANSIRVLSGIALLAEAATSNLRSWRFVGKPPETFHVTYRYRLSAKCKGNPAIQLTLPLEVSV